MKILDRLIDAKKKYEKADEELVACRERKSAALQYYRELAIGLCRTACTLSELEEVEKLLPKKQRRNYYISIPTSVRTQELVEELILETQKHADFLVIRKKYGNYYDDEMFVARWASFIETASEAIVLAEHVRSERFLPLLLSDKKFIEYFVLGIQAKLDNAKTFAEKEQVLDINFLLSKKVAFQLVERTLIEMIEIIPMSDKKHSLFDSLDSLMRKFEEEFPNNEASPKWHEIRKTRWK